MKKQLERLQNERDQIVNRLSTETLSMREFETLCRKRNEIVIKQEALRPRHFTAKEQTVVGYAYSLPSTANFLK